MENREEEAKKPYYQLAFDDEGHFEHSSQTLVLKPLSQYNQSLQQYIIEANSEVRFQLRKGLKYSNNAVLLINLPREDDDGEITYTITQPRRLALIEGEVSEAEFKQYHMDGSQLNSLYCERIYPKRDQGNTAISSVLEFRVLFKYSGSFFVQIEYFDEEAEQNIFTDPQYINVEPIMMLQGQEIRSKELSIISVHSRQLGPLKRWKEVLQNISELSYNAVHFLPIQKYGESNSHYSIKDQTMISSYYFGDECDDLSKNERLQMLKNLTQEIKDELGLLGIMDIVLNHTANNSEWLLEHPDAGYNTDDCPHLYSAWLFDSQLAKLSDCFAERKLIECTSAPYINNQKDLDFVMGAIWNRVIKPIKMHEFFQFNIDKQMKQMKHLFEQERISSDLYEQVVQNCLRKKWNTYADQKNLFALVELEVEGLGSGPERFNLSFKNNDFLIFIYHLNKKNLPATYNQIKGLMSEHNSVWGKKIEEFMNTAMSCMQGNLRYYKLELKDNLITHENKIQRRYFTELDNDKQSKLAHNGWIGDAKPFVDFAMEGWHYLKRDINIWSDSVKLRYGNCPSDSPYLWERMATYVEDMASVFDGFRLDNAHSTPINACQYLLQIARTRNPNLFVMAELFTSSAEADSIFVQKLNLNGLVRELQNSWNAKQLGDYFHQVTCTHAIIGSIDSQFEDINGQKYKILTPKHPSDIIYDNTHDNPPLSERFQSATMALPLMGLNSLSDQAIATTWGYDILLKHKIDVVNERRIFKVYDQTQLLQIYQDRAFTYSQKPIKEYKPSPEQSSEISEFTYEFVFSSATASKIQIAGDFSMWKPFGDLKKESNNTWSLKSILPIIKGQDKYVYKFIINDNDWRINDQQPTCKDSNGNVNNYVPMKGEEQKHYNNQFNQNQSSQELKFPDIRFARKMLNEVHNECTKNHAEIFMHQQNEETIVVVRQLPLDYSDDYDAFVSITRFNYYNKSNQALSKPVIELPGEVSEVVFAGLLDINDSSYKNYDKDQQYIFGINAEFKVYQDLTRFCKVECFDGKYKLVFSYMPANFTCVLKTRSNGNAKRAIQQLNNHRAIMQDTESLARELFRNSPLASLNHLLYRCDNEEKDISNNTRGPYGFQKRGPLKYAGIASFIHCLNELKVKPNMGDEIFNNMREGNWLIDYIVDRLKWINEDLSNVITLFKEYFDLVKQLPSNLRPKYGSIIIDKVHAAALKELVSFRVDDKFINQSKDTFFIQKLALGIVQMYGRVPSAYFDGHKDTMCAGLPHFSTGYMRCWGRDTFIALKGLFIATGLQDEAKDVIFQFAKLMRHGLIPNLHDRGNNTRFNARDATWFFLQAIKDYVLASDEGVEIFNDEISLFFRDDDQKKHEQLLSQSPKKLILQDIIQQILQSHAQGISFREWNAGPKIDDCMKDEGFNVNIQLDKETGFCLGGNQWNCGTWMDKMGSSVKTGNRGIPATPRDGAPIELVALQYSVLQFVSDQHQKGAYTHEGVQLKDGSMFSFADWAAQIKDNFETCFWIPQFPNQDMNYKIEKNLVNRRGIYKDVYKSTHKYTDYQLRPNVCVAMSYAADLFTPDHAIHCLGQIEEILIEKNCMGMKTLDPKDKNYNGDYINSDDSNGWNYHQGPEWLWPYGFFLKAKVHFGIYESKDHATRDIMKLLLPHLKHIQNDPWESLPELTNSHGKECKDSCTAQAWSISTILDALRDLHYLQI